MPRFVRLVSLVAILTLTAGFPARMVEAQLDPTVRARVGSAVVQLAVTVVATENGTKEEELVTLGSGTIVAPNGVILTNNHVVDLSDLEAQLASQEAGFKRQGRDRSLQVVPDRFVLLFSERDEPPVRRFTAQVVLDASGAALTSSELDLAVLQITGGSRGQPIDVSSLNLSFVELGNSDSMQIGDRVHIFGYPAVGGGALTYTDGAVSGFRFEEGVQGRAWVTTAATVSGGSSGGAAVDDEGRLIGVPTLAGAPECRPGDTNGDGTVDELDQGCVPIGGALNKVRPINLAKPLLEGQVPLVTPTPEADPTSTPTTSQPPSPTFGTPIPPSPTQDLTVSTPTPMPPSTPVHGAVAYRDGFDDPNASLFSTESADPSTSRYSFQGGEFVIEKLDPALDSGLSRYLGRYRDVVVAIDARLVGETANRTVSVTCRYNPEAAGYPGYRLSVEPGNSSFRLRRLEESEPTVLAEAVRQDVIKTGGAVNRLELRCLGTEISARVNGIEVARVEDDALRGGGVAFSTGVYSEALPGTVEAWFDDLEVRVPEQVMPEPTPVEGDVSYRDGFDDPDASMLSTESDDPTASRYSFNEGEYVIEKLDPEVNAASTRYLPGRYRDVVVAIDVRLVGEPANRTVFIYCRQSLGAEGFTAYGFSVEPGESYFRLLRYENGELTTLAEAVRQDVIEPGGAVNRLELSCIGTEISALINGIELARVEDDTVREGRVGFGTAVLSDALPGTVEARFNDLELTNVP